MTAQILVVEDDFSTARMVSMAVSAAGHASTSANSYNEARRKMMETPFDLVLCDLYLGDGTGLDLLRDRKEMEPGSQPPLIMFTAQGSVETAVEALREGASDYLAKPFNIDELMTLVDQVLEKSRTQTGKRPKIKVLKTSMLVGNSPPMVNLYKRIALAAQSEASVLISGETGTGKELVARSLHDFSARRNRPFVAVNCGALTETLLESELFGHERGSFTGAVATRKGLFEQAEGGTLFLDEITETTAGFQVKLLRALQEGEIRPVGGSRLIRVNARIVAASNQNVCDAIEKGIFRKDLYYRLGVVQLEVPPLRERGEDILQLAQFFLDRVAGRVGRELELSTSAHRILRTYNWPGNVRELENVIERVAVMKTGNLLSADDFEFLSPAYPTHDEGDLTELELVERDKILEILKQSRGNKTEAAKRLGIERKSLYRKAKRLGIDLSQFS